MIRWAIYIVGGLGAAIAIVALIGIGLPQNHRASRTMTFTAPPDQVFAIVSGFTSYPAWRTGVREVAVEGTGGAGSIVREDGPDGAISFRVEVFDPPRRLSMRIADSSLPFGGVWTYELAAMPEGSALTITEDGEVYNPIFRFMSRFVFGHHATIDRYLADLARRLGG